MARTQKLGIHVETPDSWNSVVLSLATTGGFIISHGNMEEIHVCAPKMNEETLVLEQTFLTYWIERKQLQELYNAVIDQQEELLIHINDKDEQDRIAKERDEASLRRVRKSKKKKVVQNDDDPDMDDPESCEHECD